MNHILKPALRGHFHQAAFFIALGACLLLVIRSHHLGPSLVYSLSLITLFGVSALYHRINWGPTARMVMRRFDHAAIYFLIAGTITPICLLALPGEIGLRLLKITWAAALSGMLVSILFAKKPKWLNAVFFLMTGFVVVPYFPEMFKSLEGPNFTLLLIGGVIYAIGAVIYALKRPVLFPRLFGYHEVFHCLVIVAATLHFIVIHSLV